MNDRLKLNIRSDLFLTKMCKIVKLKSIHKSLFCLINNLHTLCIVGWTYIQTWQSLYTVNVEVRLISKTEGKIYNLCKWLRFSLFTARYFVNAKKCRKITVDKEKNFQQSILDKKCNFILREKNVKTALNYYAK